MYFGWAFLPQYYMIDGKDPNDANITPGNMTTYFDAGFTSMMMTGFLPFLLGTLTPADAARLVDQDMPLDHQNGARHMVVYRLREGIERFFITDINNPAATTRAQSELPVQWDGVVLEARNFNHVPGGANCLYMDGHVSFLRYPSEHPANRAFPTLMTIAGM
jgi:prepilin-type processing-associated H-X9-DG protein